MPATKRGKPMNLFDVARLDHRPLKDRVSRVALPDFRQVGDNYFRPESPVREATGKLAVAIETARARGKPVILFMGAQPIKLGLSLYVRAMIEAGKVTHLAMTGGALLHDWEIAVHGETSEDVGQGLLDGTYGMWGESSALSGLLDNIPKDVTVGGYFGKLMVQSRTLRQPIVEMEGSVDGVETKLRIEAHNTRYTILAMAHTKQVPVTVHSTLGADIWHMTQDFPPNSFGVAMWEDFLAFADAVERLHDGGVFVNLGSAVTGPEVFLKALAMARNVGKGASPRGFTTAVLDKYPVASNWREVWQQAPELQEQRWFKNVLVRPMLPEGPGIYVQGHFNRTIPHLAEWLSESKEQH